MGRPPEHHDVVLAVLRDADAPLAAETVVRAARKARPGIGRATVYRALRRLQAEGVIERYEDGYGLPDRRDDHHHLVCIECGRTTVPALDEAERALRRAVARTGYRLLAHELTITGYCERHAA